MAIRGWMDGLGDTDGEFSEAVHPVMCAVSEYYGGREPSFISIGNDAFVFSLGDGRVCKLTHRPLEAMLPHWLLATGTVIDGIPSVEPLLAVEIDGLTAWAMVRDDLTDWPCADSRWEDAYACLIASEDGVPIPSGALAAFVAGDLDLIQTVDRMCRSLRANDILVRDVSPDNVGVDPHGRPMFRDWGETNFGRDFRRSSKVPFPDMDPAIPRLTLTLTQETCCTF